MAVYLPPSMTAAVQQTPVDAAIANTTTADTHHPNSKTAILLPCSRATIPWLELARSVHPRKKGEFSPAAFFIEKLQPLHLTHPLSSSYLPIC